MLPATVTGWVSGPCQSLVTVTAPLAATGSRLDLKSSKSASVAARPWRDMSAATARAPPPDPRTATFIGMGSSPYV